MTKTRNHPNLKNPHEADIARSEYAKALDSLTRYLALRDHSKFELKTKLERRFSPELVKKLLLDAEQNGWLASDDQIAERLALALARRHKSQMYIEVQLRLKGLPLPKLDPDGEIESVRHLVERKFGSVRLTFEEKAKALRFLKNRGFTDSAIRQVLNEER